MEAAVVAGTVLRLGSCLVLATKTLINCLNTILTGTLSSPHSPFP